MPHMKKLLKREMLKNKLNHMLMLVEKKYSIILFQKVNIEDVYYTVME